MSSTIEIKECVFGKNLDQLLSVPSQWPILFPLLSGFSPSQTTVSIGGRKESPPCPLGSCLQLPEDCPLAGKEPSRLRAWQSLHARLFKRLRQNYNYKSSLFSGEQAKNDSTQLLKLYNMIG